MEINVGDYVRTKDGLIAKVIDIDYESYEWKVDIVYTLDKETYDDYEGFEEYSEYVFPDQFIKHSKNIIDIIEERRYSSNELLWL